MGEEGVVVAGRDGGHPIRVGVTLVLEEDGQVVPGDVAKDDRLRAGFGVGHEKQPEYGRVTGRERGWMRARSGANA